MASNNSKRPRRSPHSGRMRESTIKTGKRGANRVPLDSVQLVLLGKGRFASFRPVGTFGN